MWMRDVHHPSIGRRPLPTYSRGMSKKIPDAWAAQTGFDEDTWVPDDLDGELRDLALRDADELDLEEERARER